MSYSERLSIRHLQPAKTSTNEEGFIGIDSQYFLEFELLEAELDLLGMKRGLLSWLICGLHQRESYAGLSVGIGRLHNLRRIIGLTSSHERYDVQRMRKLLRHSWL